MPGINQNNSKKISGIEHLRQSIRDILRTPKGSRLMRRDYGSQLFELIDQPLNANTRLDLYAAVAEALDKWEPRLKLEQVTLREVNDQGQFVLDLKGRYVVDGIELTMEGLIV